MSLVFRTSLYRAWTWREMFTRAFKDPLAPWRSESDRFEVAKNLSLEIRKGDRLGILGVNGAGKTSLCRCITGIYQPTSGQIRVRGKVRAVFDCQMGIQPELTGRENAELLSEFMYPELERPTDIVPEALEFSGLGKFLDMPFRLYSAGMQTRLCLSVATAMPSDLLILDEVFEGADEFFRAKASERVLQLMERSGAVVFVSHAAEHIRRACNRVVVLSGGKFVFDGPVEEGLKAYHQQSAG